MTNCTEETLTAVIARFGGRLVPGRHAADTGACCVLEARSVCLGIPWTDNPAAVGMPDIRALNDAPWSKAAVRTAAMIRLAAAYDRWATWPAERQTAIMSRVAIAMVREITSDLPGLPVRVVNECKPATTLAMAWSAASAAWSAAESAAESAR